MSVRDHNRMKIDIPPPITVLRLEKIPLEGFMDLYIYVLMGPTGAGKSAFIEAIAQDKTISISKNSLDSVTQDVIPYALGHRYDLPIVLIDTPGLLDIKITESSVIRQVLDTISLLQRSCHGSAYVHLLYFERITDNRMSGRKLRGLNLFKFFAEHADIAYETTVVTTMWNEMFRPEQFQRAYERIQALEDEFWKHLSFGRIGATRNITGTGVTQFMNTQDSALSILKSAWFIIPDLSPHVPFQGKRRFEAYISMTLLSRDILQQRMTNIEQKMVNINWDTASAEALNICDEFAAQTRQEYLDDFVLNQLHRKELSDVAKECIDVIRRQLPVIKLERLRMKYTTRYSGSSRAKTAATEVRAEHLRLNALLKSLSRDVMEEPKCLVVHRPPPAVPHPPPAVPHPPPAVPRPPPAVSRPLPRPRRGTVGNGRYGPPSVPRDNVSDMRFFVLLQAAWTWWKRGN